MPIPDDRIRQLKVLISSTRADLNQYRQEARKIIDRISDDETNRVRLREVSMEHETQSGDRERAVAVSKRWVEESHWVIVIVAWNYGTVSDEPGADGLSVTEWEYRHACQEGKKIFVFAAGEPGTAEEYHWSREEKEDLKNWGIKQTAAQKEKLDAFRRSLLAPHTELFDSLERFRDRLEKTLRNAIQDLPPDIQPGTPLAELIVAVVPIIRACLRKVTLVADCKTIHDHLHELRQHVVRPLREEVLPMWKQEGPLSTSRERMIWRCLNEMSRQLGSISQARKSIDLKYRGLCDSVDTVLTWGAGKTGPQAIRRDAAGGAVETRRRSRVLWDLSGSDESRPTVDRFAETVDDFAADVQQAFTDADGSMTAAEGDLRDDYAALREALNRGRRAMALGAGDQQRLDDELRTVDSHRASIRDTLAKHHCWQDAHDKLEEVGGFRDLDSFERKLDHYQGPSLNKVLALIESEFAAAGEPANEGDEFLHALRQLVAAIKELEAHPGVPAFDEMRRPFDDAFYMVDQRTKAEVKRARDRVEELEQWLDELTAAQRKAI